MAFECYKRHKGDIQSKAEKDNLILIYHRGDILIAVNGEDIGGEI